MLSFLFAFYVYLYKVQAHYPTPNQSVIQQMYFAGGTTDTNWKKNEHIFSCPDIFFSNRQQNLFYWSLKKIVRSYNQTDYTYLYMFLLFKQKSGLDFFDINAPKSFVLDGSTSIAVHLILITNTILGALVCIRMYSDILPYLHVILVQIIHIERRWEGYTKYKTCNRCCFKHGFSSDTPQCTND